MRVVVAGGHGKIALLLERLLAERGGQAVGLVGNPAQVADVQRAGAEAVFCDLEEASADDVAVLQPTPGPPGEPGHEILPAGIWLTGPGVRSDRSKIAPLPSQQRRYRI